MTGDGGSPVKRYFELKAALDRGDISSDEKAELKTLVENDPDLREQAGKDVLVERLLQYALAEPETEDDFARGVSARIAAEATGEEFARDVLQAGPAPRESQSRRVRVPARTRRNGSSRRAFRRRRGIRPGLWWSFAACLAALIGSAVYNEHRVTSFPETLVARIEKTSPGVTVHRRGDRIVAVVGMDLFAQDMVETRAGSRLTFSCMGEHTRIALGERTALRIVRLSAGKRLELRRGLIEARVAPQPADQPFMLRTPQAHVEVKGTVFDLFVTRDATSLRVREGSIALTSSEDGSSLLVSAGEIAAVQSGVGLITDPAQVAAAAAPRVRAAEGEIESFGGPGQDISVDLKFEREGETLRFTGNGWKRMRFPYTITPNTILEFDFRSPSPGEIHGIGFHTGEAVSNATLPQNHIFKLYGTQDWGIRTYCDYAPSAPKWKHYVIPVGRHFTGAMTHMIFANDHDQVRKPTAESFFSNIKVYEKNDAFRARTGGGDGRRRK
jgi:hypothetical protein